MASFDGQIFPNKVDEVTLFDAEISMLEEENAQRMEKREAISAGKCRENSEEGLYQQNTRSE
jgi:hypothetical protein